MYGNSLQVAESKTDILTGVPQDFNMLSQGESPWTLGVAASIGEQGVVANDHLSKYFSSMWFPVNSIWTPESQDASPRHRVIGEMIADISSRYKQSELYAQFPDAEHQIYGEVRRSFVTAEGAPEDRSDYDDSRIHVDFVPDNSPSWGVFFFDKDPTLFYHGKYGYQGQHQSDYENLIGVIRYSTGDVLSPAQTNYGTDKVIYTEDSRMLLHSRKITSDGWRTFGRLFVGPRPQDVPWGKPGSTLTK